MTAGARRFEGKIVLVVGAARGVGLATAQAFAGEGARLSLADIDPAIDGVASELPAGTDLLAGRADVTDPASVDALVAATVERFGRVDVLAHVAGVLQQTAKVADLSGDEWDRVLTVNAKGPMHTARAVIPHMREQGGGRIVNVGSDVGYRANYFQSSYAASKFALDGFSQSMRLELRRFGIAVSLVSPGWYETEFGQSVVTTFTAGELAPLYADLIADWEAGVGGVEGPNLNPQEVADRVVEILREQQPRYRYPVGWNPDRIGTVDPADIDRFQGHLVDFYRMDAPSVPTAR